MYIGIDIGGTRCRIALVKNLDQLIPFQRYEFLLTHNFEDDFALLVQKIRAEEITHGHVEGIGFGAPGDLNPEKTEFVDPAGNLREWSDQPIKKLMNAEFDCPFFMENDGVTAALGEAYAGAGKDKDFSFVIWGTGIGGAVVTRDTGMLSCTEYDWYKYFQDWERTCGGRRIREIYGKDASLLNEYEWRDVIVEFERGLKAFVDKSQESFIIFGGGIALKQQTLLREVAQHLKDVVVTLPKFGEDAGLFGALVLLKMQLAKN